jgi:hypothetical protein
VGWVDNAKEAAGAAMNVMRNGGVKSVNPTEDISTIDGFSTFLASRGLTSSTMKVADVIKDTPLGQAALVSPFEVALSAGVRFETENEAMQRELASLDFEQWILKLYIETLQNENAALVIHQRNAYEVKSVVKPVVGTLDDDNVIRLQGVRQVSQNLIGLLYRVVDYDNFLHKMAYTASKTFAIYPQIDNYQEQKAVLKAVADIQNNLTSDKVGVIVGGDIKTMNTDLTRIIESKQSLIMSIASMTSVPYSTLSQAGDASGAITGGTGESFERYKILIRGIQQRTLYFAYIQFFKALEFIEGKMYVMSNFDMIDPFGMSSAQLLEEREKEIRLAMDMHKHLVMTVPEKVHTQWYEERIESIEKKYRI